MDEKRLFLLDAYALIYRAYYALIRSPRITSKGFNASAVFGFCNTLDEILRKERPTHIAVCFDPAGGQTFRHRMYADYKAGRDKQPEDITLSIPWIKKLLGAYRIPVIECEDYEADDIIGTLSRKAQAEGFTTYMMTPDKDYGQLVTDRVFMYRPSLRGEGFEIRGPQQVCERYGISSPAQVIDLLALEGDASDNIPGCPGVGEKTAAKLISEWGSVDNLLANTDKLKGAIKRKIEDNARQIRFSYQLATICTDAPIDIDPADLVRQPEDAAALEDLFVQLEFRTFIRRLHDRLGTQADLANDDSKKETAADSTGSLFAQEPSENALTQPTAIFRRVADTASDYTDISDIEEALRFISRASECEAIGVSLLSSGPTIMRSVLEGLAIATAHGIAARIMLPGDPKDRATLLSALTPLLADDSGPVLAGHDMKRTYLLMKNEGIVLKTRFFDTAVAHYLVEPEMKHIPPYLASKYLELELSDPSAPILTRACELADIALRLREPLTDAIRNLGMSRLLDDIELPLIPVLAEMEWTGVRVDTAELSRLSADYSRRLSDMEQQVYQLAGTKFNVSSPMQVGEVLFDRLKIDPKAKRTKKGAYSTTEDILSKYAPQYPVVDLILKIRALRKLLATYIDALPALINPATGKIHTSYNQTVTATGRISSTDPNLQNIPVRSDDGREIRRAFIADPGDLFMSADYSQIELRLIADLSGDEHMIESFRSGADIHRATAAKIYHLPIEEVTDTQRRNAKTANFGIIYGISAFGLSERLGIPRQEAKMLIDGYLKSYPKVEEYMKRNIEDARRDGYVSTIMGRRRMLPDINSRSAVMRGFSERNAVNAPLQGSAADIIKRAMIDIDHEISLRGLRSRMIMQVHDELIFNVKPDELPQMQQLVTTLMEHAYSGNVALEVSAGVGNNWLEAH